jgi:hypothetical protein
VDRAACASYQRQWSDPRRAHVRLCRPGACSELLGQGQACCACSRCRVR